MNHVFATRPVVRALNGEPKSAARPPVAPLSAYVLGCVVGGALMGSLLGAFHELAHAAGLSPHLLLVLGLPVALLAIYCQWQGGVRPLPERRKQVPRRWLHWSRLELTGLAFGVMIGFGAVTYLRHASAWALAVLVLAVLTPAAAVLAGATYGFARSSPTIGCWLTSHDQSAPHWWSALGMRGGLASRLLVPLTVMTYAAAFIV